jgi:ZIP family zinc transporter
MLDFLMQIPPIWMAVIATTFTWGVTALGAATVFFFKTVNRKLLDLMMGFSAGVMIAASFWSLLAPAIELSETLGYISWLWPAVGFAVGGFFVILASKLLDKAIKLKDEAQGKSLKRSIMLVSSITLHNIPEGLSVGVAFGAFALGVPGCESVGAFLLALGIGIQNFPEGVSVALPLRREGMGRGKAFFYGQASGVVEPIAAIIGFYLATLMRAFLPFALAFSAGAMISVVCSELIPEANEHKNLAVIGSIVGFLVMMVLDVALG